MNRIYIIGNGFDLSHGLPTSYDDFLKFLIKKEVFSFIDYLIKKNHLKLEDFKHPFLGSIFLNDYFRRCILGDKFISPNSQLNNYLLEIKNGIQQDPFNQYKRKFSQTNENEFFSQIIDNKHYLWGKIEIQYFDLLKKYHKEIEPDKTNIDEIKSKVKRLNNNLEYIKNQ